MKNKKNVKDGLSLIALITTLIVLIIIVGAIIFTIGDDEIIENSEQTLNQTDLDNFKDAVQSEYMEWQIAQRVNRTDKDAIEYIKEKLAGKYSDELLNQINISKRGEIVIGDMSNKLVIINSIDLVGGTSNINISVNVTNGSRAKYIYYYKQGSGEYIKAKETSSTSCELTGLTHNVTYTVKVEATNDYGTTSMEKTITLGKVSSAESAIEAGELTWSNGKASVKITKTTTDDLTIKYKIGTGSYITIESGETISNLSVGDVVTVVLTDGINYGNTKTINVLDVDLPNDADIDLSATTADVGEGITADVILTDNQSGVDISNCKWIYTTTADELGTDGANYTGTFTSTDNLLVLTANEAGTYYLHVLTVDKSGNAVETISSAVTVGENVSAT